MRQVCVLCLALLLSMSVAGCNSDPGSIEVPVPAAETQLKSALDDLAQTGVLGSGAEYLDSLVAELRASDAGKAAALEADLQELKAARDPAQVKAKAKAMAAKL